MKKMKMIWWRADVLAGIEYRLELCQDSEGYRFFRLLPVGAQRSTDVESLALTETVTRHDLLLGRDTRGLSRHTKLESESYFVDWNGIWFLAREWNEWFAGRKCFTDIAWATRMPPKLPPK